MKNTILILVLCLFIGSCKDSLTVNEEVDTITASIEQEDEISLFDFVSQVRLIPLETTDSSLVAHITKIITSKDRDFYLRSYPESNFHFQPRRTVYF